MADYPPGWNDPPSLSFSQSSSSGKRNLLNKRVPFPLNSSTVSPQPVRKEPSDLSSPNVITQNQEPSDLSSPNVITQNPLLNNVTHEDGGEKSVEECTNLKEEEILPFVNDTFEKILFENSNKHEKKRIEEINQRLKIMKESWDQKISSAVKQKMFILAKELSKGNAEAALKIQCALMVDHLREVKQWMVGVKHIIEMERQKNSS